jgi:hypothetical protein
MSEEVTQQEQSATPEPSTAPETLDDVFKSYNVEHQPAETQQYVPQPQQAKPAAPEYHIPDPALDPDGFRKYEASKSAESHDLRQALQQVVGKLSSMETGAARAKEEADIAKAVGVMKEEVPGAEEEMLEVFLAHKARKDPRVLQVWNNRGKNPKAWDATLKAITNEASRKFEVRTDPQLAENQRAMKTSQQSMATAQRSPSTEETMGALKGADFDREWDRIRQGF